MSDPIATASDGMITSEGETTPMTIATMGYIVEVSETIVDTPSRVHFPMLGGGFAKKKSPSKEKDKYKKIKIKVIMPDDTSYEKEFTIDDISLSVSDITVDDKEETISFSIISPHTKTKRYDGHKIIMELKNNVTINKK